MSALDDRSILMDSLLNTKQPESKKKILNLGAKKVLSSYMKHEKLTPFNNSENEYEYENQSTGSPLNQIIKKSSRLDISYRKDIPNSSKDPKFREPESLLPSIHSSDGQLSSTISNTFKHISQESGHPSSQDSSRSKSDTRFSQNNIFQNSNMTFNSLKLDQTINKSNNSTQSTPLSSDNSLFNYKKNDNTTTQIKNEEKISRLDLLNDIISSKQKQYSVNSIDSIERLINENRVPSGRQQAIFVDQWFRKQLDTLYHQLLNEKEIEDAIKKIKEDNKNQGSNTLFNSITKSSSQIRYFKKVHELIQLAMYEVIRQVSINCLERGQLLGFLWVRTSDLLERLINLIELNIPSYLETINNLIIENNDLESKIENNHSDYEVQVALNNTKILELDVKIRDLDITILKQNKRIVSLEGQIETSIKICHQKDKEIKNLKKYGTDMQEKVKNLEIDLFHSNRENENLLLLKDDYNSVKLKNKRLKNELKRIQEENEKLKEKNTSVQDQLNETVLKSESLNDKIEILQRELKLERLDTQSLVSRLKSFDKEIDHKYIQVGEEFALFSASVQENQKDLANSIKILESNVSSKIFKEKEFNDSNLLLNTQNNLNEKQNESFVEQNKFEDQNLETVVNSNEFESKQHPESPLKLPLRALEEIFRNIYKGKYKFDSKNQSKWKSLYEYLDEYFTSIGVNPTKMKEQIKFSMSRFPNTSSTILFDLLCEIEFKVTKINSLKSNSSSEIEADQTNYRKDFIRQFILLWGKDIIPNLSYSFSSPGEDKEQLFIPSTTAFKILYEVFSFASNEDLEVMKQETINYFHKPILNSNNVNNKLYSELVNVHDFFLNIFLKYWDIFTNEVWKQLNINLKLFEQKQNIKSELYSEWETFLGRLEHFKPIYSPSIDKQNKLYTRYLANIDQLKKISSSSVLLEKNLVIFCNILRDACSTNSNFITLSSIFQIVNQLNKKIENNKHSNTTSNLFSGYVETISISDSMFDEDLFYDEDQRNKSNLTSNSLTSWDSKNGIQRKLIRVPDGRRSKPPVRFSDF